MIDTHNRQKERKRGTEREKGGGVTERRKNIGDGETEQREKMHHCGWSCVT